MIDWKEIVGFPHYRISNTGLVLSVRRQKILRLATHQANGDKWVVLQQKGQRFHRSVHSLVLEHFVCPRPVGAVTRHLDGNAANNHLDNLAWGSMKENMQDRDRHGTTARFEKSGRAKLTQAQAREARKKFSKGAGVTSLARLYEVNPGTMSKLVRGITWRLPP